MFLDPLKGPPTPNDMDMPVSLVTFRRRLVKCERIGKAELAEAFSGPCFAYLKHLLSGPTMVHGKNGTVDYLRALLSRSIDLLEMVEAADDFLDAFADIAPKHRRAVSIKS